MSFAGVTPRRISTNIYRACLSRTTILRLPRSLLATGKSKPPSPSLLPRVRNFSFANTSRNTATTTTTHPGKPSSPLGTLANTFARNSQTLRAGTEPQPFFPDISSPTVGYWLLGSAGLVFGIVVLGGLTRLTESGLSITEWKPITGTLSPEDWESNFSKYRSTPEYRILNPNMSLDEYKFIYCMEWTHRLLGRIIGLSFVLPAIYFVARGRVTRAMALRLGGISGLIALEGGIGWWMQPGAHPRVSQYRLTAHLGAAFAVYAAMLWNGLSVLRENRLLLPNPKAAINDSTRYPTPRCARSAILDAGLIYNEFPKMGNGYIPPLTELMDPFYARQRDHSDLWWRNILENPTTVQFDHRCLAISTFFFITGVFAYSRLNPGVARALTKNGRRGIAGVMHLAILQVLLGVGTLVYMVPTHLAATHQAGSLALLTGAIVLASRVWLPRAAVRAARRRLEVVGGKNIGGKRRS
ncbi:COX15-CtaA-domain-containing protein [Tuber magnatum]|uniref:COX15-CtaA-domain-containing protein n=1 Tax=Tuber magnatum TaxID=42249 RepID=A0A317SHA4_9PEZI|nr:COX15-CtaA-domain-containing protein [Tuber magnatum]